MHAHTTVTDGRNSIEKMAKMANNFGHKYLAITDHSQHVRVAGGLDVKALKKHSEDIDRVNDSISGINGIARRGWIERTSLIKESPLKLLAIKDLLFLILKNPRQKAF